MSTIKMAPGDTLTIGRDIRIKILEIQPGDRGIVVHVEVPLVLELSMFQAAEITQPFELLLARARELAENPRALEVLGADGFVALRAIAGMEVEAEDAADAFAGPAVKLRLRAERAAKETT